MFEHSFQYFSLCLLPVGVTEKCPALYPSYQVCLHVDSLDLALVPRLTSLHVLFA